MHETLQRQRREEVARRVAAAEHAAATDALLGQAKHALGDHAARQARDTRGRPV